LEAADLRVGWVTDGRCGCRDVVDRTSIDMQ
jgi:hypothetical protein